MEMENFQRDNHMSTISDKLRLLANTKADIKAAIEDMGVPVGNIPFSQYAEKIRMINAVVPYFLNLDGLGELANVMRTCSRLSQTVSVPFTTNGTVTAVAKSYNFCSVDVEYSALTLGDGSRQGSVKVWVAQNNSALTRYVEINVYLQEAPTVRGSIVVEQAGVS